MSASSDGQRRVRFMRHLVIVAAGTGTALLLNSDRLSFAFDHLYLVVYRLLGLFGVEGARVAAAQQLGSGCFGIGPIRVPDWAVYLEAYGTPSFAMLMGLLLACVVTSLVERRSAVLTSPTSNVCPREKDVQFPSVIVRRRARESLALAILIGFAAFHVLGLGTSQNLLRRLGYGLLSHLWIPGADLMADQKSGSLGYSPVELPAWGWLVELYVFPTLRPAIALSMALGVRHALLSRLGSAGGEVLCRACEYRLVGNTSGICPECGTVIPEEQRARLRLTAARGAATPNDAANDCPPRAG